MALQGAEVLLYPTAIGSDPPRPGDDSRESWQLAQRGHAVANTMPVVAANRIGLETARVEPATGHAAAARDGQLDIRFYGSSFIADPTGRSWPRRRATAKR